jgi:hypothetical protein
LKSETLRRRVKRQGFLTLLSVQLFKRPRFYSDSLYGTTVRQVHLLPETLLARTRCAQSLEGIGLSAQSFIDLTLEFLFLLGETTELRLSHFDVAPLILAITVVTLSGAKVNLAYAVVFRTAAAFLNHSISKIVEEVGEFETSGGAVASTDSGHLKNP